MDTVKVIGELAIALLFSAVVAFGISWSLLRWLFHETSRGGLHVLASVPVTNRATGRPSPAARNQITSNRL